MSGHGVTVVTGGTRGIGLATAQAFVESGSPVIVSYRRDVVAARAAAGSWGEAADVTLVECDLSESAGPLIGALESDGRPIETLVVNAAASVFRPLLELAPHHVRKTLAVTVESLLELVRGLAGQFASPSSITIVSSGDTVRYIPGHGLLGGAKAALEVLGRYLAVELAPRGIRVNTVLPGPVETDSARTWAEDTWEGFNQRVADATPAGRIAQPEDIARVIRLLSHPDAAWINGQVIIADGGMFFADRIFSE